MIKARTKFHSTLDRSLHVAASFFSAVLQLYGLENGCSMDFSLIGQLHLSVLVWRAWTEHALEDVMKYLWECLSRLQTDGFCGHSSNIFKIPIWLPSFLHILAEKGFFFLKNADPSSVFSNVDIFDFMKSMLDEESLARWTRLMNGSSIQQVENAFHCNNFAF